MQLYSTRAIAHPTWLGADVYAQMIEPLMLEVSQRLRPVVCWQRVLSDYQNIIALRYFREGLVLSAHVHGQFRYDPCGTMVIDLSPESRFVHHRYTQEQPIVSWHLGQCHTFPGTPTYGRLECYRFELFGHQVRSRPLRHDHPAIPKDTPLTDDVIFARSTLADDIVAVTQVYIDCAA